MRSLLTLLVFCLPLLAGCRQETGTAASEPVGQQVAAPAAAGGPLDQACAYLWSQQAEDGGWHSETYGLLKSGQAYTPFLLHTLLTAQPDLTADDPRVRRALDFLRKHVSDRGVLGEADPDVLEYPNYSTAYALLCLVRANQPQDRELIQKMTDYLLTQQFREANGFSPEDPPYGGFGFGGVHKPGETGHMDLAHTRRVLQALRASAADSPQTFQRAQTFLRYVQKHPDDKRSQPKQQQGGRVPYDGGFYFSPIVLMANKGRLAEDEENRDHYRSYATATCDGILALRACGTAADDERIAAAVKWLDAHPRWDYPEGIPTEHPDAWGAAVQFYHCAVRAEVFAAIAHPGDWRETCRELLAPRQRADGSFQNTDSHLMKEDDPLLCTALAAIALCHCGGQ